MEKQPFFNIVIPTRERSQTLLWTLKTCLNQDYSNYKIIVSDNCSQDETFEVVSSFRSDKIEYYKTPNRLSMSHNWEFALKHIREGYIIFLGDDDGLVKNSLSRLAKIITKTRGEAYRLSNITYYWDNQLSDNPFLSNMCYNIFLTNEYHYIDSKHIVDNIINTLDYHGSKGFLLLPSLYHGCIHSNIINEVKEYNNGIFFNSNCPDMFSALIIALKRPQFIYYKAPVCINGLSKFSNGLSSYNVNKRTNTNKIEFDRFIEEMSIPFSQYLIRDISLVTRHLIPRPLLVADQFYKLRELYPEIKVPSLESIVKICLEFSFRLAANTKDLNSYLEIIKHLALNNNLESLLDSLLKDRLLEIPNRSTPVNDIIFSFDMSNNLATLNTKRLGLQNVYDVSIYIQKLFKESQSICFHKPRGAHTIIEYIPRHKLFWLNLKSVLKKYLPQSVIKLYAFLR